MNCIKIRLILVFLLTVILKSVSFAGSEAHLFVPNQYAPLSSYVQKTTASFETLVFNVKPEIVQYVVNNAYPGWVARKDSVTGLVSFIAPTSYNTTTGVITLITNQVGKYVIVAEPFTNDFPVVTHWHQALNNGKGGQQLGASDPINTIDFLPEYNVPMWTQDINDTDLSSPYQWNTAKYALFGDPSIRVPTYETYVGENYSVNKITDLFAVSMSLKSVESNGYPVLHRNYPWAIYQQAPANQQVGQNIPAFQIVHGVVLEAEAGKPSLSSYILPPLWSKTPTTPYAIMFNGHYDLNLSTAVGSGPDFIKVMADLKNDNVGSAIGVLWNGGGAYAAQTTQASSHLGAAYTMYVAQVLFAADPMKVVTTGISRGAHTAITVAGNPYFSNYKVQYALAYCPPVAYGEHAMQWFSPNYAQNYMSVAWATGYKYVYKDSFVDPITGLNGRQLFLYNVAGTPDPAYVDSISPVADMYVNSLKAKGTNVMFATGLNDAAIPSEMQLRMLKKYIAAGVPTEMHIGHRFGHNYFTDRNAQLYWAMKQTMQGTNTNYANITKHYRRAAEIGAGDNTPQEFTPGNFLSVNFPKLAWPGLKVRLEVTGSQGLAYAVAYHKIDDAQWINNKVVTITGPQNLTSVNSLNSGDSVQGQFFDHTFPANLTPGYYVMLAATSTDQGANWNLVDPTHVPQLLTASERITVFEVKATEPSIPALNMNFDHTPGDRGWGVSTY